ncbi:hypothetical protein AALA21_02520 [Eggerthellaceae bacterium 3-80]|nr:hypothetical protein D7W09_07870 [bacterium D16-34]
MKIQQIKKWSAMIGALVLASALMLGCSSAGNSPEAQQQAKNRQFMAQINQTMDDLNEKLDSFNDAVAAGDLVNMRTQADSAFKVLDSLDAIEAPEGLEDVKQDYVDGSDELESALNAYIDLYTEINSATEEAPFDWSSYDSRMADIKSSYDDGISKLQAGDEAAANKE